MLLDVSLVDSESFGGTKLGSGVEERRLSMLLGRGMKAESRLLALCRSSGLPPDRGVEAERGREVGGRCDGS